METVVTDIRALLWQFQKADLRDFHFRSDALQLFLARSDGAANPMLTSVAAAEPEVLTSVVSAPHLGLFEPFCAVGDVVAPGNIVAQIDVLGRKTDVFAPEGGRVVALGLAANDLVEYGDQLFALVAA